ncbi:MAG: plastocyanin/azurin family copper-binding protein [Gaiellaceae bacterium]
MKFVALAAIVAAIAAPAAGAATGKLVATDGPGFTISLKQGGKTVKTLKAGTYTITVQDKSNIHNFHLIGPGVNKATSVGAVKTYTWKVTLKKGTYKYICDPHKTIMKGSFTVT